MNNIYDWVTLAIFAGLIVLFLQRSHGEGVVKDSIWQYLGASVGCAVANWLGTQGFKTGNILYHLAAIAAIAGTLGYIYYYLKPFEQAGRD